MKWSKTVDIKRFLNDDDLSYAEQAEQILKTLREVPEFAAAQGGGVLAELDSAVRDLQEGNERRGMAYFNAVLNDVYDVADRHRIWLGI